MRTPSKIAKNSRNWFRNNFVSEANGSPTYRKNYKQKKKIPGFWIFSLLDYGSEGERKSLGFRIFRKCGLLLGAVRPQHVLCESKCDR